MLTRLVGEYELDFDWRGFELHPETPRGGVRVDELFRGVDMEAMRQRMQGFAASFGVEMGVPDRMPNTRRALAVAELARDQGRLTGFRDAVMDAHWTRGLDIEDDEVLAELLAEVGLEPEAVSAADDAAYVARVDALGGEARQWGVSGIPTYFFLPEGWTLGDPLPPDGPRPARVVGCQPYERVLAACLQAGVARRET